MDQELNQKIDAFIAANREQLLDDIAALVAINSVEAAPAEGAPFGEGARAALDKALELAGKMGLATHNCEGYIGYAELPGADPDKYLATICHVDVVPAGEGWEADPFTMRRQDGWILGRGVMDDKGPMVVTLYALKFLKEMGVQLRYPIRALAGTNEETGMKDVEYYLAHNKAPAFCFTPDAEFPVCNGEKGHFHGKLVSPVCKGKILSFTGGVANNAVPDRASALVDADIVGLKNAPNITLEPENGGVRVRGWGKSGHAASPEGTVNAIGLVVDYLLANNLCTEEERKYLEALHKLHSSTAGEGLGIATSDGPFGPLTIIGGRIYMEDGRMVQTMDSRYPTSTNGEVIAQAIRNFGKRGYARLGGLILNAKNIENEEAIVQKACSEIGTEVIQYVPRSPDIQSAESKGATVFEGLEESRMHGVYRTLAQRILSISEDIPQEEAVSF